MKNLCIVAHPDDEIIFAGASLIESPSDWHVICVTNGDNPNRRREFNSVMSHIGCSHEIWSFNDTWKVPLDIRSLTNKLSTVVNAGWDVVLTHGSMGDVGYEHPHHVDVHNSVLNSLDNLDILHCFSYSLDAPLNIIQITHKLNLLSMYESQIKLYKDTFVPRMGNYLFYESTLKYAHSLKSTG